MVQWHFSQWKKKSWSHASLDAKLVRSAGRFCLPNMRQWKYLPRLLSLKEKIIALALAGLFIANGIFLGSIGFRSVTAVNPAEGGSYTEGLVGAPQYINPLFLQNNDADRDLSNLMYSSLIRYDEHRKAIGDLAESYEVSPDGTVYTFRLRQGVVWHDGKPFSANDVVATFSKVQDPGLKSPLYVSFKDIKIEKKDDRTVVFTLSKAFAPFLDLMTVGILPEHIWKDIPNEQIPFAAYNLKPIGTGPWSFKTLQKEQDGTLVSYTVVRNEVYYATVPLLDKITFKFYPDTDAALQALKNRNVQGISFLPRDLRDRLKKDGDLAYYTFHLPQYTALFFNPEKHKSLASKKVRQALGYAIDKERIVTQVFGGEGSVIAGPILAGFAGYDESLKPYPFDLAKAAQILSESGWKKNDSGQWYQELSGKQPKSVTSVYRGRKITRTVYETVVKPSAPLSITLVTADQEDLVKTTRIIEENWKALGIIVDVQVNDPSRIKEEIIDPRAYDVFVYGEIIGSDPDLYPFWHSSQMRAPGLNLAAFSNKAADTLLEDARTTSDGAKRPEMYKKFQQILAEEQPAIFLVNPSYNYVVQKKIQGISDNKYIVYPSDRFVDAAQWYVRIHRSWKK
ncbi:MAG: ABC transporter substrate-binding protein [Patescibacteria group bacterium]